VQMLAALNGVLTSFFGAPPDDAHAMVYILDDGRSFVRPEPDFGPNSTITVLSSDDPGPDMDS
jgi:hypothetical protein